MGNLKYLIIDCLWYNFHKILINKDGKIADTFASFTTPMSNKILKKLEEIL